MSSIANKLNINKWDKPHLPVLLYDLGRKTDMFNAVLSLDTHEILQCNLMYKIPFTITDDDRNSLIHILIKNSSKSSELAKLSVIKFLINNGVDPDKPNKYNQTVLHLACNQQLEKIVEYLLKNHANPNYKDNSECTPFHYLLRGSINPVPPTEIINFISPTNNVNLAKVELIKTINDDIKTVLETLEKLPIFDTIKNTIIAFINNDAEIKTIIQEFTTAQLADLEMVETIYSRVDILESVKIFETKITQRIKEKFLVKSLDNLSIHTKVADSYIFDALKSSEYAFIIDGNINKSIRKIIKSKYTELETITQFTPYAVDFIESNYFNLYNDIYYELYIKHIEERRLLGSYVNYNAVNGEYEVDNNLTYTTTLKPDRNGYINPANPNDFYYNSPNFSVKEHFIKQDKKLLYTTASDNASSIINFNTRKYTGGPRNIQIGYNNLKYDDFTNINTLLNSVLNLSDDTLIRFMLYPNPHPPEVLDDTRIFWRNYDDANSEHVTPKHMLILIQNVYMYELLSLYAIKYKLKQISQAHLEQFHTSQNHYNDAFFRKWHSLWKPDENFDLGAWIFNMWTDCSCRASRSNLVGFVHFKLLILINNLNNTTDIKASIINSLKPHLISLYTHNIISAPAPAPAPIIQTVESLITIILILLCELSDYNDIINYTYPTNITTIYSNLVNITNERFTTNNDSYSYTINNVNIKYICFLLYNYFRLNNSKQFNIFITTIKDTEILKYYNNYKSKFDKFIDILCNMILDEYKIMTTKPVEQTILDFLFLLNKFSTTFDLGIFKNLSICFLLSDMNMNTEKTHLHNETRLLILTLPSYLGYLNVSNSDNNENLYNILLINHFNIAHILGLYYEGTLDSANNQDYLNFVGINTPDIFFTPGNVYTYQEGQLEWAHTINTNNLLDRGNVPLSLQYINANIKTFNSATHGFAESTDPNHDYDYNEYVDFYNLWDKQIIIPTIFSYFIFIYNKIKYYQQQIKELFNKINKLIRDLITGNNTDSNNAYIDHYFTIIMYSKIINNYYKSYIELQKMPFYKDAQFTKWIQNFPLNERNSNTNKLLDIPIPIDKLAEILNKINSSYYIYHYIYQQGKKIKLDKFNYYQLPLEYKANKFLYYSLLNGTMFNVYDEDTTIDSDNTAETTLGEIGTFTIDDITDYNKSYTSYLNNPYLNNDQHDGFETESFIIEKSKELPPSVYVNFNDFYKYTTIYLIIEIISRININDTLFKKSKEYIKKYIKPPTNMSDIYTYYLISKIIEQLIINNYDASIKAQIISQKINIMKMGGGAVDTMNLDFLLYNLEKQTLAITLDNSTLFIGATGAKDNVNHLYNLVIPPATPSEDKVVFILYPNDLTNINKFKIKNGITIKPNIIKLLINSGGIPYNLNMENSTPIDYLLKNYQIDTIKKLYDTLKTGNITFYNSKNSIKYIFDELNNMLGKIIITPDKRELKSILSNFHEYLYEDIHQLILANTQYGNNEFIFIPLSFNISTYLILHYLKINIETGKQHIYLYTTIDNLQIYKDINAFIADEILVKKEDLLKKYKEYLESIKDTLQKTDIYKLNQMIKKINNEISYLKTIITKKKYNNDNILCCNNASKLISAYQHKSLDKDNIFGKIKSLKLWEKFFDNPTINFNNNYDMKLIKIIIEQMEQLKDYEKLDNTKLTTLTTLKGISDKLKIISTIAENYFTKSKFTDDNETSLFIKDMLNYVAGMTFETSIILLVRRILFTYFRKIYSNPDTINTHIKTILATPNISGDSFTSILRDKTIPDLVILASNIYKNKQDEMSYETKTSRQILLNLFAHLKEVEITLSEEILNTFDKQVVEYLDTFIVKTIEMWHVNAENIFKYFINNYRCLATLICLLEHK